MDETLPYLFPCLNTSSLIRSLNDCSKHSLFLECRMSIRLPITCSELLCLLLCNSCLTLDPTETALCLLI